MLTKEKIIVWSDAYDSIKYPIPVYNDLVVEDLDHPNKFSVFGAWKQGT